MDDETVNDITIGQLMAKMDGTDPSKGLDVIVKMANGDFIPAKIQNVVLRPEDGEIKNHVLMAYGCPFPCTSPAAIFLLRLNP